MNPHVPVIEKDPCVHRHSAIHTMLAGGISGVVAKTTMAPLSRLVILYQVTSALPRNSLPSDTVSLFSAIKRIINEEGLLAFWKGNLTSVLHRFPYSAINFSVYENTKNFLVDLSILKEETLSIRLLSGAIGGGTACILCYPLDLIRTRLTVDSTPLKTVRKGEIPNSIIILDNRIIRQSGIVRTFVDIVRLEGFRGLYRGLTVSLSVNIPSLALSFSAYGTTKELLLSSKNRLVSKVDNQLTVLGACISGASSGILSSLLVYPADLIRRRMQVRGIIPGQITPSLLDEIIMVWRNQNGILGFYRGIVPELLKVTPTVGITFCVYEFTLQLLQPKSNL